MIKIKKGIGHVEVIISFLIFISFVMFLLIFFNPIKSFSKNTSYLDIAEAKILEYASTDLTVSSLKLDSMPAPGMGICFYLDFSLPEKIIVKDESSVITPATRTAGEIYFEHTWKKFYKIYSSDELEEKTINTAGCQKLDESNYTRGVTNVYKKAAYSNLAILNNSYNNNYDQLKKDLNLKADFNIVVKDTSGNVIFKGENYKPEAIEVMARDIPIEILDKDANLIPAIMNLQVWD